MQFFQLQVFNYNLVKEVAVIRAEFEVLWDFFRLCGVGWRGMSGEGGGDMNRKGCRESTYGEMVLVEL